MTTHPERASGEATTRPDRRVERTRRLLRSALLELVLKKSYDRITIQEILDRADVGRSTFYAHFRNKDELLVGDLEFVLDPFVGSPENAVVPNLAPLLEHVKSQRSLLLALEGTAVLNTAFSRIEAHLEKRWRQQLEAANRRGEVHSIPPAIAAVYLSGALVAVLKWWLRTDAPYSTEQLETAFRDLTLDGIGVDASWRSGDRTSVRAADTTPE